MFNKLKKVFHKCEFKYLSLFFGRTKKNENDTLSLTEMYNFYECNCGKFKINGPGHSSTQGEYPDWDFPKENPLEFDIKNSDKSTRINWLIDTFCPWCRREDEPEPYGSVDVRPKDVELGYD